MDAVKAQTAVVDEFGIGTVFDVFGFVAPDLQVKAFFVKGYFGVTHGISEVLVLRIAVEDVKGLLVFDEFIDGETPCCVRLADLLDKVLTVLGVEVSAL